MTGRALPSGCNKIPHEGCAVKRRYGGGIDYNIGLRSIMVSPSCYIIDDANFPAIIVGLLF